MKTKKKLNLKYGEKEMINAKVDVEVTTSKRKRPCSNCNVPIEKGDDMVITGKTMQRYFMHVECGADLSLNIMETLRKAREKAIAKLQAKRDRLQKKKEKEKKNIEMHDIMDSIFQNDNSREDQAKILDGAMNVLEMIQSIEKKNPKDLARSLAKLLGIPKGKMQEFYDEFLEASPELQAKTYMKLIEQHMAKKPISETDLLTKYRKFEGKYRK